MIIKRQFLRNVKKFKFKFCQSLAICYHLKKEIFHQNMDGILSSWCQDDLHPLWVAAHFFQILFLCPNEFIIAHRPRMWFYWQIQYLSNYFIDFHNFGTLMTILLRVFSKNLKCQFLTMKDWENPHKKEKKQKIYTLLASFSQDFPVFYVVNSIW